VIPKINEVEVKKNFFISILGACLAMNGFPRYMESTFTVLNGV